MRKLLFIPIMLIAAQATAQVRDTVFEETARFGARKDSFSYVVVKDTSATEEDSVESRQVSRYAHYMDYDGDGNSDSIAVEYLSGYDYREKYQYSSGGDDGIYDGLTYWFEATEGDTLVKRVKEVYKGFNVTKERFLELQNEYGSPIPVDFRVLIFRQETFPTPDSLWAE